MSIKSNEQQLVVSDILTKEDVDIVAKKYTNEKSVRVLNYHLDDYSDGKLGFLGDHRNLIIELQRSNGDSPETVNFFIKSIPYNCKEQADFMKKERIFIKESNFFNFIPQLIDNSSIERWFPACYLAKDDAIVMEDLRSLGYAMHKNIIDDTVALKSVLYTLAQFHSCSILTESRLNQCSKKSATLNERYPDYFAEKVFQITGYGPRWFFVGANLAAEVAKRLGFDPIKVHNAYKQLFNIVKPSKNYCNVICHGDLWANNMMLADSSPLLKCILVDFQIIRYAPLVTDLLQFFHLNATRKYREKYEHELVKFYHNVLEQTVRSNDSSNTAKSPSLEDIFEGMEELRTYGLVMATLYLPFALLDPKIIAECTKDSESYNRFVFEDRTGIILGCMEENESYKNKIEEAVIELLETIDETER